MAQLLAHDSQQKVNAKEVPQNAIVSHTGNYNMRCIFWKIVKVWKSEEFSISGTDVLPQPPTDLPRPRCVCVNSSGPLNKSVHMYVCACSQR